MKLKGLSPKEELSLSRSINTRNTGFKPELSPVEVGQYLNKCIESGNTIKELTEYFGYIHTKSINEFIIIYKNLNKNIAHLVVFADQDQYKKGLNYITYDKARIIAKYNEKFQEKLALATIDYQFSRYDLEGISQRMERSKLPFEEVLEEFKKRKEAPIVTTLIAFFLNKQVLELMSTKTGVKKFYKVLESTEVIELLKQNKKRIVQAKCSSSTYSLTISGGMLDDDFKNDIDYKVEKLLLKND